MKKLIIFLIVIAVLVLGVAYAGFVPVVSPLLGTNKPRDLGVKYTKADYESIIQQAKFKLDNSAGFGPDTRITYSPNKITVEGKFTQEQVSALINFDHADGYPVSNTQIKIHADGTLEGAAQVGVNNYKGYSFHNAVYVKGKIDVTSAKSLKLNPEKLEVGRLPVPINEKAKNIVETAVNEKLNSIPGLAIESVSFEEGKVNFKGTIPESAKRVKK